MARQGITASNPIANTAAHRRLTRPRLGKDVEFVVGKSVGLVHNGASMLYWCGITLQLGRPAASKDRFAGIKR